MDVRKSIHEEATALAKETKAGAQHYLKVMDKVVNRSVEYLDKEAKRYDFSGSHSELLILNCFFSLESILKKRTLSEAKLDEIKIKFNILRAFAPQTEEENIGRAESEL